MVLAETQDTQYRILQVLTQAMERFLRASDWEAAIDQVLADLGTIAQVSRVCVFVNARDEQGRLGSALRYEWTAAGVPSRVKEGKLTAELRYYPWYEGIFHRWAEILSRGEIIKGNVRDFPPEEAEALRAHGLYSTLVVPIFVRGTWWGFIGFDDCVSEREWTATDVDVLRAASNILAAALERRLAEEEAHHKTQALAIVGHILEALNATADVEEAFPAVVSGVRTLTGCDRVSLVLFSDDYRYYRLVLIDQPRAELARGTVLPTATSSAAADILAGRPHLTPDLGNELGTPAERMLYEAGHRSRVNIPLRVKGKILGSLNLTWPVPHGYREDDVPLLQQVADALALAIERTYYLRREEQRREIAEALRATGLALISDLDLNQVLERILTSVAAVIPYDSATIFLHKGDHLRVAAMRGFPNPEEAMRRPYPVDNPLFREIERTRHPIFLEDAQKDPRFENWNTPYPIRGWMGIPLIARGEILGFLTLDSSRAGAYGEQDVRVAEMFAQQAALALYNARLYQSVLSANDELKKALSVRAHIVRTVSHELRTPLTLIVTSAELLKIRAENTLPERLHDLVNTIVHQARHVSYMLNQFLAYERVESIEMAFRPFSASRWLRQIFTAWQPLFEQEGQTLRLEMADNVGEIYGHPEFLQRVMDNLLDNARRHSAAGATTTIRAWRERETVYIAVADQGKGVPPEALSRLFEPFYQVERTDLYPSGGLGLGLALCKEIVERHGGRIWAESKGEGTGLTVTFALKGF